ncbi:FxDxF family PEP-CTERM protein [Aquincola tertiaricarbonis]|uniref:FxDxF family PEP-CTERM protein n=1 Tax=Aquincola tertiaricarbonis TaxID=391953 RepID=UPI000614D8F4|nr:FxDxF family PEP-CTERM protein [Aquincola tertiaricarbonis]
MNLSRQATRRLATVALAAAAALGATTAQAVDLALDWGTHGPARLAQHNPGPEGSFFVDTYSFSLDAGSWQIASTAVANELMLGGNAVYSIIGGSYGLYADPDGTPESGDEDLVGGTMSNFDGTTGELSMQATVGQGRYYYLVTGLAFGSAGGAYQLTSAVAAVPEPGSAAMLLAGAAVLGGIGWRRRRGDQKR